MTNVSDYANMAAVPLCELLTDIPEGIRLTIDWPNDGGVVGRSSYMPVGHYCHKAAEQLKRYETALKKLACLGNGDMLGNSEGNIIAQKALK